MLITSFTGREFGPMLKAERRARAAQSGACPKSSEPGGSNTGSKKEPAAIWVAFGSIALLVLYLVASLLAKRGDTITLLLRSAFLSGIAAMAELAELSAMHCHARRRRHQSMARRRREHRTDDHRAAARVVTRLDR